jgi:hypothetical protein
VIGRLWISLSEKHCLILVHDFVVIRIRYCASIYNGITKLKLKSLQRVLNAAQRLTIGKCKQQSIDEDKNSLQFMNVDELVHHHTCSLIHSILSSGFPSHLRSCLTCYEPSRNLRSSEAGLLQRFAVRSNFVSRAFSSYAPTIWNAIPLETRCVAVRQFFKKESEELFFFQEMSDRSMNICCIDFCLNIFCLYFVLLTDHVNGSEIDK